MRRSIFAAMLGLSTFYAIETAIQRLALDRGSTYVGAAIMAAGFTILWVVDREGLTA